MTVESGPGIRAVDPREERAAGAAMERKNA
jgi:hypothetical protein